MRGAKSILRGQYPTEYQAWVNMRGRCRTSSPDRKWYYDKGIRVCGEWDSFAEFLKCLGPKPTPKHSLDRIDGSVGYQPSNVRWADIKTQRRNRSSVKLTTELAAMVRRLVSEGHTQVAVGRLVGMTQPGINHVVRGRSWV